MKIYTGFITLVLVLISMITNRACAGVVIDFEDLEWRNCYVGDSFTTSGMTINIEPTWNGYQWMYGGTAYIRPAAGAGKSLGINGVMASFLLSADYEGLTLKYATGCPNLAIEINGDLLYAGFADIDGISVGGALVNVARDYNLPTGTLTITGTISSFKIGGVPEFMIDDVQFIPEPGTILLVGLGGVLLRGVKKV